MLVFNQKFEQGDYRGARDYLASDDKLRKKHNLILYNLNYATASFMMDDSETSIKYFAEADNYVENFQKNYGYEALALISNPTVRPYELEYFERVMIHFYQALNYVKINNFEEALVECRRMNIELERISDSFRKHDGRRYSRDAFGHYLMGIVYETMNDNNNAFIAYRNAYEIYHDDYQTLFNSQVPDYLKTSLIRTAYRTGFKQDGAKYEKEFGRKYKAKESNTGRVVAFVLDGLSPVKSEKSIELLRNNGVGYVTYASPDGEFSVPIFYDVCTANEKAALGNLDYMRMTLPVYLTRSTGCTNASQRLSVTVNNERYPLDEVENIDLIAKQSLKDRQWSETGKAILRVATKEAMKQAATNKNEYLGLLMNIANTITEKADTRGWQSLPGCIRLIDIEVPAGQYAITYSACGTQNRVTLNVQAGRTSFTCL